MYFLNNPSTQGHAYLCLHTTPTRSAYIRTSGGFHGPITNLIMMWNHNWLNLWPHHWLFYYHGSRLPAIIKSRNIGWDWSFPFFSDKKEKSKMHMAKHCYIWCILAFQTHAHTGWWTCCMNDHDAFVKIYAKNTTYFNQLFWCSYVL